MDEILFFDMDGVLAVYERSAYDPAKGVTPGKAIYEDESLRYFRTCRPDPVGIGMLKEAIGKGYRAYIVTSVRPDLPWARFDKVAWLARHVPEFDASTRLVIASGDKAQLIMAKRKIASLDRRMVLFDDYNRNLEDWRRAGGTAVKYLNGLNTPASYSGPKFDASSGTWIPGKE